jgi:hypothetical protein
MFPLWRGAIDAFCATAIENHRVIRAAADGGLPLTRRRLDRMASGWLAMGEVVKRLFESELRGELPRAPVSRAVAASWFLEGHGLLLRDWCGSPSAESENRAALELLLRVRPARRVENLLVLGAGGARLAVDAHRALGAERTVALDINPLAVVVAERVLMGETVVLQHLPNSPAQPEDAAVARRLCLRGEPPEGFAVVFADARAPPVVPGAFDSVLTPWYIDQVDQALPDLVETLRALLPPGGVWLHLGPLVYRAKHPVELRLTLAELCELASLHGFIVEAKACERMPHLLTPEHTSGRVEEVYAFSARRL